MPPSTAKTLSPAELQKLEHAFATDPASEAYKPLAEAYLSMGRYMEAMVVCKKGVKAHPAVPDARVLLARVYADQGKDKKALEELAGALQVAPNDKVALRLCGALQLKGGEAATGKTNLLKAFEADPNDADTLAAMQQFKVEAPKKELPPPPPPPEPVHVAAKGNGASAANAQVASPTSQSRSQHAPVSGAAQGQRPRGGTPARGRPSAPRQQQRPHYEDESGLNEVPSELSDISDVSDVRSRRKKKKSSGGSRALFFLLIFAIPMAVGAYFGIGQYRAKRSREVKRLIQQSAELLKNDTFDSYKKACEKAEAALDLDPASGLAHTYLAYAYTVRWGEHERDDTMRVRAEEHLKEAGKDKEASPSFYFAAQALHDFYSGRGGDALKTLEERVKTFEADNRKSSLLNLTAGILLMSQGDLERAKESLDKAQSISPDDPRIYVALGNLNRRRGSDTSALQNFASALKFTRNSHPDALIGTALLVLDQENPALGYVSAATYLKTLLDADPPPSPRQLALGHFVKALLVSRVSTDIPLYKDAVFQKKLEEGTGITADAAKARSDITKEENEGTGLDRSNPELLIIRGKRYFWEGKYDEAGAEIQKAIEQNSSLAHFHVELAKVWLKKTGGEPQAEAALRKAVALVPNSPKLLAMLGGVLYRQKKIDEAATTLERAIADTKTKNPEARFELGKLYRDEKKEYERSAALLEKAAQEYYADPTMAAQAYDELGYSWELKGDKDKTRAAYEKALNADSAFAPAYCHYARYLSRLGDAKDKETVKKLAAESLKLDPRGECAPDMQKLAAP